MALILENDEILLIEYRINSSMMLLIIRIAHRAVVSGNSVISYMRRALCTILVRQRGIFLRLPLVLGIQIRWSLSLSIRSLQ